MSDLLEDKQERDWLVSISDIGSVQLHPDNGFVYTGFVQFPSWYPKNWTPDDFRVLLNSIGQDYRKRIKQVPKDEYLYKKFRLKLVTVLAEEGV